MIIQTRTNKIYFGLYNFWIKSDKGIWMLKFPWNRLVLFSERSGYWKHRKFMGFRWGLRP